MNEELQSLESKAGAFATAELGEFKTVWTTHPAVTVLFGAVCGVAGFLLGKLF